MIIPNPAISRLNTFTGSATQQATSVTTNTDSNCYEFSSGCYSIYGFEVQASFLPGGAVTDVLASQYKPGFDDGVGGMLF
jgi:hypothetical protein